MAQGSQICIVTVTGKDRVGIIASLANTMAKYNINIVDVDQKIMENCFVMNMAVDTAESTIDISKIKKQLDKLGKQMSLNINIQNENIFKTMHRI